jgi:hypothetical protein
MVPREGASLTDPAALPPWITETDIDVYVAEFTRSGFRGSLNWWRNIDRSWELMAAFDGAAVTVPALYIVGDRDMLVAVDPAGTCSGGKRRHDRLPSAVVGSRLFLCDRPARRGTSRRSLVVMRRCPATSEPSATGFASSRSHFQKNHMNDQPENLTRLNEVSR